MKKIYIMIMIVLLFIAVTSAEWTTKNRLDSRFPVILGQGSVVMNDTQMTTFNFTCGTGTGGASIQSIIRTDITGGAGSTENPALITFCTGDSVNAAPHFLAVDTSLEAIDSITTVSEFGMSATDYFQFDVANVDADSDLEVILYHWDDVTGSNQMIELIVYQFNITTDTFELQGILSIANNTANYTFATNDDIPDMGASDETDQHIECIDELCLVFHERRLELYNMSSMTNVWFIDTNATTSFTGQGTIDNKPAANDDAKFFPIIQNNDNSGTTEINLFQPSNSVWLEINFSSGAILQNEVLSVTGADPNNWFLTTCTASQCPAVGINVIVIGSAGTDEGCEMFDTTDGDFKHRTEAEAGSTEKVGCWIEDRDSDNGDELCATAFDIGDLDTGVARCEEMNILSTDTLSTTLNYTNTAGSQDNNIGSQMVFIDYDNDGLLEMVTSSGVWDFVDGGVTDIELAYINETMTQTGDIPSVIVSEYTTEGSFDIINIWETGANQEDVYFVTVSGDVEDLGEGLNTQIAFRVDELGTLPYNNIWFTASDGFFTGSPLVPLFTPDICTNTTSLLWTCDYSSGCLEDDEFDDFIIYLDCFNDGTQVIQTGFHSNSGEVLLSCDPSGLNNTFNASFQVWDSAHNETENVSQLVEIDVTDQLPCNDETDLAPGDFDPNSVPQFIATPEPLTPVPYCENSSVIYTCDRDVCYTDEEDDNTYMVIDCDNDGIFTKTSVINSDTFTCFFDNSSQTSFTVQICDTQNVLCDVTDVDIDVTADCGQPLGSPELLFGDNQGIRTEINQPFCTSENITFFCELDLCYTDPQNSTTTDLFADCDNDDVYETTSLNVLNHSFNCEFAANITTQNVQYFVTNNAGDSDIGVEVVSVSNVTAICNSQAGFDLDESEQANALVRMTDDIGNIFNMDGSTVAYIILFIATIAIFFIGATQEVHGTTLFAVSFFVIGSIIFTLTGVIGVTLIVIYLIVGSAILVYYKIIRPTTGLGG